MNLNHIIDGSHIQVPRMDGPQGLRNSPDYWAFYGIFYFI
jgi:hypothetical protein